MYIVYIIGYIHLEIHVRIAKILMCQKLWQWSSRKMVDLEKIIPKNRQFRKEHRQFECQQIMKSEGFLMVWWFSHHFFESRLNRRHLEGDFATGIWVKWRYTAKHQDWSSEDWTCQTNLPALDWNLVMTGWFDDWNSNPKTFSLFAMIQHKLMCICFFHGCAWW